MYRQKGGTNVIAIVNISTHNDMFGENEYSLRINTKEIGRFKHIRSEKLSECLKKAAECAEKYEYEKFCSMMDGLDEDAGYKFGIEAFKEK